MDNFYEKDGQCIIWGNVIEKLDMIPNESVDLVFIDPPYNIGKKFATINDHWTTDEDYLQWCYSWIDKCVDKLKKSGSLYIMTSTQFMPYFDLYLRKKMVILSRIIWEYDSSGVQAKNYFGSRYEPILYCVKDRTHYTFNSSAILVDAKTGSQRKLIDYRKPIPAPYSSTKIPGNVWHFNRVRYRMEEYENHPTQKPTALMERIIRASSNEGDVILDPFAGTFTTGFVAKKLGRKSINIEIASQYVEIGLRRLQICESVDGHELVKEKKSKKQ